MRNWLLIIALGLGNPLYDDPVSIKVSNPVVMAGGTIRVICKVPRNFENRGIEIALVPYRASYRSLDGDRALVTHEMFFDKVPCDTEYASCTLETSSRKQIQRIQHVEIAGCQ